jgi:hypothetical protein
MYTVRHHRSGWARIWITDDGCFTCITDYGNYGYWWGAVEGEFRAFLIGCDDCYLGGKLAGGQREFDAEHTRKIVRERILSYRKQGYLGPHVARYEWNRAAQIDDEGGWREWCARTHNPELGNLWRDAWELASYSYPSRVRGFLKNIWPVFVEQLKQELLAE